MGRIHRLHGLGLLAGRGTRAAGVGAQACVSMGTGFGPCQPDQESAAIHQAHAAFPLSLEHGMHLEHGMSKVHGT
jgi:hypothetical protein